MSEKKEIQVVETRSPAEIITTALASGADPDMLEKMLTMQERWEANEARKAYHAAMAEFKKNPPEIDKDKKVEFDTSKGKTSYNHASLYNVTDKITKALSDHGFSVSWFPQQNGIISVTCRITHCMGHSEEATLSAPSDTSGTKNPIQAIASTISYLERYTVLALTGLATKEMDDDGKSAGNNQPITEEEYSVLQDWLVAANRKETQVCKFLKIESFKQLTRPLYNKAIASLKATAEKK